MVLYILKLNKLYFLQCFIIVHLNVNRVGTHNITGLLEHLSVNLEVDSQTLRPLVHIVLVNPLPRSGGGDYRNALRHSVRPLHFWSAI